MEYLKGFITGFLIYWAARALAYTIAKGWCEGKIKATKDSGGEK